MAATSDYKLQLREVCLHLEDSLAESTPGPVVLCLHGFPDSPRTWDGLRPALEAAGFRVLVPALPGYAPSGLHARNDYRVPTLARVFLECLDVLGLEQVHVVGHDWGAVISYALANLAPQRIASMVTAAVPHPRALRPHPQQLRLSWYMGYFQLPGAVARVAANDLAFIDRLWRDWSPQWQYSPADIAAVKQTLRQPQNLSAALGYYRAIPQALFSPGVLQDLSLVFGPTHVPTRCVAGANDGCMRLGSFAQSAAAFQGPFDLLRLANAGHFMHREQPQAFHNAVLDWFGQYPQQSSRAGAV